MHTEAEICGQILYLLPERCLFWPSQKLLMVADVHLGKAGHFRKEGIPISSKVHHDDLLRLAELVEKFAPERLIILGDLFHSMPNEELELLRRWLQVYNAVSVELVLGNHDIFAAKHLGQLLTIHTESLIVPPFLLTHEPLSNKTHINTAYYYLCGHLHPSVRLRSRGGQSMRLPCFWLAEKIGVLPAFGKFTGLAEIRPSAKDQVYAIAGSKVIRVN